MNPQTEIDPYEAGPNVQEDWGVPLPTERGPMTENETYEQKRDHEQLGRPRTEELLELDELAPPATQTLEDIEAEVPRNSNPYK